MLFGYLWFTAEFLPRKCCPLKVTASSKVTHSAGGGWHLGLIRRGIKRPGFLFHFWATRWDSPNSRTPDGIVRDFDKAACCFHFSQSCFLHPLTGIVLSTSVDCLQTNPHLKVCFSDLKPCQRWAEEKTSDLLANVFTTGFLGVGGWGWGTT